MKLSWKWLIFVSKIYVIINGFGGYGSKPTEENFGNERKCIQMHLNAFKHMQGHVKVR